LSVTGLCKGLVLHSCTPERGATHSSRCTGGADSPPLPFMCPLHAERERDRESERGIEGARSDRQRYPTQHAMGGICGHAIARAANPTDLESARRLCSILVASNTIANRTDIGTSMDSSSNSTEIVYSTIIQYKLGLQRTQPNARQRGREI
jgi:hypothetical protein